MNKSLQVIDLGKKEFGDFYKLHYRLWLQRIANDISDCLIFTEHPHVILVGKSGSRKDVMVPSALMRREEIPLVDIDWEGTITYRGPGQMMIYPVLHLTQNRIKLPQVKSKVEKVLISLLYQYGIKAEKRPNQDGVWVDGAKIACTSIEVSQGVTQHSVVLNVNPRLSLFRMLQSKEGEVYRVTSMYHILKKKVDMKVLKTQFVHLFQEEFGFKARDVSSY